MRLLTLIGLLTLWLVIPAGATTEKPGQPPTPVETLDCAKDNNKDLCTECGGGGLLACCWDECDVINKPKKIYLQPLPPVGPIQPWPGSNWELF